jgi:hypothetical protein
VAGARSASAAAPIPVLHPARLRRSFPATTARRLFPPHHRAHQLPRGISSSHCESYHAAPTANLTTGDPHRVLFFRFPASICLCDSFCFLAFFPDLLCFCDSPRKPCTRGSSRPRAFFPNRRRAPFHSVACHSPAAAGHALCLPTLDCPAPN